jgi:hypothetical protein
MKTKKSETKTSKPAAPKPTAVPPASDDNYEPLPDWLFETLETQKYEYVLMMWPADPSGGDPVQNIDLTLHEHCLLKEHLADIRKLKPVKTVASMERGMRRFEIAAAECEEESGPDWLETPDCRYSLETWIADCGGVQEIQVTREEFIALKRNLALMRAKPRRGKAAA